LPPMQI